MSPQIFITGATGYIGGDTLAQLVQAHPDWQVRALVRDETKAAAVTKVNSAIVTIKGDLDSLSVLEEEAKNADVVLNLASSDHVPAINALIKGLSSHGAQSPGYLIHCSGTGILTFLDLNDGTFGERRDDIWDDVKDIEKIRNIPDNALHRNVEKAILEAGEVHASTLKTAIVCPPQIYGTGRGSGNNRSIQLPDLVRGMIANKHVFHVGKGQALWSDIHVRDLSKVFVSLAENAAQGGGKADWCKDGYYFVEAGDGDFVWADVSAELGQILKKRGLINDTTPVSYSAEQAHEQRPYGNVLWGTNSRSRASRARKVLGWQPTYLKMSDAYEGIVDVEIAAAK